MVGGYKQIPDGDGYFESFSALLLAARWCDENKGMNLLDYMPVG